MTSITVTDTARDTIRDIDNHVKHVEQLWSRYRPTWALNTAMSATRALATLFTWGDVSYSRDGRLSLYGQQTPAGMVFGVISSPLHQVDIEPEDSRYPSATARRTVLMGLYCMEPVGDDKRCCTPVVTGKTSCDHEGLWVTACPIPTTWSFHS